MTAVRLADLPPGRATAVADGSVVVVRGADGIVCAFASHCPHADESLDGALVTNGVIVCPHHFWRFDVATGANRSTGPGLQPVAVAIDAGVVDVEVPDSAAPRSFRDMMLEHARSWRRGD